MAHCGLLAAELAVRSFHHFKVCWPPSKAERNSAQGERAEARCATSRNPRSVASFLRVAAMVPFPSRTEHLSLMIEAPAKATGVLESHRRQMVCATFIPASTAPAPTSNGQPVKENGSTQTTRRERQFIEGAATK